MKAPRATHLRSNTALQAEVENCESPAGSKDRRPLQLKRTERGAHESPGALWPGGEDVGDDFDRSATPDWFKSLPAAKGSEDWTDIVDLIAHQDELRDIYKQLIATKSGVTIDEIIERVSDYYGLDTKDMLSARRTRSIARPRQFAMFLAYKWTNYSLPFIGEQFGGRDHTTVLHAIRRINELLSEGEYANDVQNIQQQFIENHPQLSYGDDGEVIFSPSDGLNITKSELLAGIYWVRRRIIEKEPPESDKRGIDPRFAELDRFAKEHPGEPVSAFMISIFPELALGKPPSNDANTSEVGAVNKFEETAVTQRQGGSEMAPGPMIAEDDRAETPIPTEAPHSYKDRVASENPISFIRRHYAPWLGHGLTRSHLRILDERLYNALASWESRHPEDRLTELPTKKEAVSKWVDRVRSGQEVADTPEAASRFASAVRRRGRPGASRGEKT